MCDEIENYFEENKDEDNNICIIKKRNHNEYIFFLDTLLEINKNFRQFYVTCKIATKKDIIRLVINSDGGNIGLFSQIYNNLITTKAKTISEIYTACSAAAFIALVCDKIIPMKFCTMMLHSIQSDLSSNCFEISNQLKITKEKEEYLVSDIIYTFLTKKEKQQLLTGETFWFNEKEINKRLKEWIPYRKR